MRVLARCSQMRSIFKAEFKSESKRPLALAGAWEFHVARMMIRHDAARVEIRF